jgi:hypothetical protein
MARGSHCNGLHMSTRSSSRALAHVDRAAFQSQNMTSVGIKARMVPRIKRGRCVVHQVELGGLPARQHGPVRAKRDSVAVEAGSGVDYGQIRN